ncbi:hypothetical protein CHS0354_039591 [Potamilus streckersoni]|uniref:NACHT domain-containing protein n=1 Tax=Potamilus streckersoni TaxID=2493646 RepID=A0AAE0RRA1_9BIVA|nr:hypothetical protein CHS0354_039591 [Potamilus streckersoni]
MRHQWSISDVILIGVLAVQFEFAHALSWKPVTTNIVSCVKEQVLLTWEYEVDPGEYVKAKTWFTGVNRSAIRIAYWKDTDGLTIESAYKDRIELINDSLLLRDVKSSDEGLYTLIPSIPSSSEPDPKLTLNLTVYISPLEEEGCCKPDINASHDELHAFLHSEQGCGKPSPILIWNVTRNKAVSNYNTLMLGNTDKEGTYKACVIGPAVDRCFKGNREVLCKPYIVQADRQPQTNEIKTSLPVGAWIGIGLVILMLVMAVIVTLILRRKLQKSKDIVKEAEPFLKMDENVRQRITLLETALDVHSLTKELAHFYQTQPQKQVDESDLKLQTVITDGITPVPEIDINIYSKVLSRNGQPLNRILIQGEVGCGKKTWCDTLIHEWCKVHGQEHIDRNQSCSSNHYDNDNISFLKEYQLLFNISLSKVQNFSDLNDLLKYLHISLIDQLEIDIKEYVKKYKTIIIIQSLDEYRGNPSNVTNILSDEDLNQTVVIVTSTPHTWSRSYQETSVHRIVHVKGLDVKEMEKRAQKILKSDGFPQDMIDQFFTSIREKKLEKFATDPVFFPFLVKIWKKYCVLPPTRVEFLLNFLENQLKWKRKSIASNAFRFDFDKNMVFKGKLFIIYYGKIVQFLGQIAFRLMELNRDRTMVFEQDFEDIFSKQNVPNGADHQFILSFCKEINLVSTVESDEGLIENFSFSHKVMVEFLAAIYISNLKGEKRQRVETKVQSLRDCNEFLSFVSGE